MTTESAVAEYAIAESRSGSTAPPFAFLQTVISQYANSPIMLKLLENMADYLDVGADFDRFFALVWNVDTAIGYGLDVWGRIVGVSRVLQLPGTGEFFDFSESGASAHSFGEAIFYGGGDLTSNFALSDAAYRKLIFAKALANISNGSIPGINQILINLFSQYGNCYVIDNQDMTVTYSFGPTLSAVDYAVAVQSGVLPKPAGVTAIFQQRP
jgi:Protein of unknown function (DUF2612)